MTPLTVYISAVFSACLGHFYYANRILASFTVICIYHTPKCPAHESQAKNHKFNFGFGAYKHFAACLCPCPLLRMHAFNAIYAKCLPRFRLP